MLLLYLLLPWVFLQPGTGPGATATMPARLSKNIRRDIDLESESSGLGFRRVL